MSFSRKQADDAQQGGKCHRQRSLLQNSDENMEQTLHGHLNYKYHIYNIYLYLYMKFLEVFSSASRSSIAFAIASCTLSALLALFVSGAVAAAYTIAYSAIAAQTVEAFRLSRARYQNLFVLALQYSQPAFSHNFDTCCRLHLLWSCILIGGTAVGACASPHLNLRVLLLLLSVIICART